jgi:hypothetical protein
MESLTEASIAGMSDILRAVLSSDNQNRKIHEAQLAQLRQEHPNQLVLSLLYILSRGENMLKALAAVLLRQMFSVFDKNSLWLSLTPEVHEVCKKQLLEALKSEQDKTVRHKLCDTISELGTNILSSKGKRGTWEELVPFIFEAAYSGNTGMSASALKIFSSLYVFVYKQLTSDINTVINLVRTGLTSSDVQVKTAAVDACGTLICVTPYTEGEPLAEMLPGLLQAVAEVAAASEVDGKEALEDLSDMAEAETKFFRKNLEVCYQFSEHILNMKLEDLGLKYLALEFLVTIAEKSPKLMVQNTQLTTQIVALVFRLMTSVEYEVDESWARPKEGYQDAQDEDSEELDIDYVKRGRRLIARLVENIGDTKMLPIVLPYIQQALAVNEDWRMKYTGLMTIAELGSYINQADKVAEIVPIMISHTTHSHPKIRYAAYHCIGQISEDYKEEFQSTHHAAVCPVLIGGCDDTVPRVVAHCCAAICNFFTDGGKTITTQYAPVFVPKLTSLISGGQPSVVIEGAVTGLSAIVESSRETFAQYYNQILPYLLNLVSTYKSAEYANLRGRCVECITIMSEAVGKEMFQASSKDVIALLRALQDENIAADSTLKSYIMSGWQRVCVLLKEDFVHFMPDVVPGLLRMAGIQAEISISTEPESFFDIEQLMRGDKKRISVSTSETEDKEIGLQTILSIISVMRGAYAPYVEATIAVAMPLLEFKVNETIRGCAASLLGSLPEVIRHSGNPDAIQNTKNLCTLLLGKLWQVASDEFDSDTLTQQLEAIKAVLEAPEEPFLSAQEINIMGEKAIKVLDDSIQRRLRDKAGSDEESEEEDISEFTKKEEDELHTAVSDILGSIFKTHATFSLDIVNFLYEKVLSKFLAPEASSEDHKFAIFVIDDIIEFIGQEGVGDKWNALCEAITRYADDTDDAVRQAAVYGLGVFAAKSSPEVYSAWSASILQKLEEAIKIPPTSNAKTHGYARDNAIAALGRIIKHQSSLIDLNTILPVWVNFFPLRHDKIEARLMHDFLADLTLSNTSLVDDQNLSRIVHIFSDILETKLIAPETVPKARTIFIMIQSGLYPNTAEIWNTLSDTSRAKITNLIQ